MYAILDIGGHQYRVEKGSTIKIPLLSEEVGKSVEFNNVLLVNDGKKVKIGHPTIEGAKVSAKVLEHGRDNKVTVFKKKRRKRYRLKKGHRQPFTRLEIKKIA